LIADLAGSAYRPAEVNLAAIGWNGDKMRPTDFPIAQEPRVLIGRRLLLTAFCCGLSLAPTPLVGQVYRPRPKRPNLLWIVAENVKLDFGCYGAQQVLTPNVDSLAARGLRFTRVFATAPACATSRSAFMTGMYQTSTDTHHMRSHRSDDFRLPAGVRPLTHWLQDAGYYTANITTIDDHLVGTGKLDLNFVNEGSIYQGSDWSSLKTHQPYFAQVNLPEVEYDIYDRQSAAKPRVEWVGEREHPPIATPENVTPPPYYPDHSITRQEWARYLNSVSGLDRRVGRIIEKLRADNLEDDTVIFFFADNGRLEARGIHWCYDTGLHVPLIVVWPKNFPAPPQIKPGGVNDDVVSLLDFTATTLWIAGVTRPALMQSRIFLGPTADPPRQYAFSARDRIDETVNRIRSVREARFHYIRNYMPGQGFASLNRYKEKCFLVIPLMRELYAQGQLTGPTAALMAPLPPEQLFDTAADPHEIKNLADSQNPDHREALIRMRAALDVWISETGDRGEVPEPPDVVAPFEKEMHEWFGTPAWYYAKRP
jgi:N-sulfoglucosamine sulfohydrolase